MHIHENSTNTPITDERDNGQMEQTISNLEQALKYRKDLDACQSAIGRALRSIGAKAIGTIPVKAAKVTKARKAVAVPEVDIEAMKAEMWKKAQLHRLQGEVLIQAMCNLGTRIAA